MSTSITLSPELQERIEAHILKHGTHMTLQEACEKLMIKSLSEDSGVEYEKPSEDAVKERLQSLGYID